MKKTLAILLGLVFFTASSSALSQEDMVLPMQAALVKEPDNDDIHYFLALSCFLSHRYKEALSAINESIRLNPANAEAHYTLGQIYMKLGQYKKAIAPLQTAMNIEPPRKNPNPLR